MKKFVLLSVCTVLTSSLTQAAVTIRGGEVHFSGEFVNAACAVSTDTANQTIALGQYRTAFIHEAAQYTANVPFRIKLVDCDPEISKTAKFAFNGPLDTTDSTLLRVSAGPSSNATVATGIGIEINDSKGKPLTPDGSIFSSPTTLITGDNTVHFVARYKSTAEKVTAGEANAHANFIIQYE